MLSKSHNINQKEVMHFIGKNSSNFRKNHFLSNYLMNVAVFYWLKMLKMMLII